MFRFALLRRAFATKTTTGIVGLPVEPNAHVLLKHVYMAQLEKAAQMPDSYLYKQTLVPWVENRLKILSETSDHAVLESKFDDNGPIEETLEDAEGELQMMDLIIKDQIWKDVNPDAEFIVLPPGVHHEDRLELIRDAPPSAAGAAATAKP